jgi:hypothetical protein
MTTEKHAIRQLCELVARDLPCLDRIDHLDGSVELVFGGMRVQGRWLYRVYVVLPGNEAWDIDAIAQDVIERNRALKRDLRQAVRDAFRDTRIVVRGFGDDD